MKHYIQVCNIMNISEEIIAAIQNCTPITFAKFGDGEYNCMFSTRKEYRGCNCDRDSYTHGLASGLRDALQYLANKEKCYIGKFT